MTRYALLRQAVANLAAPAPSQVEYLDGLFSDIADGQNAAGYGNDELALELDDIFSAANHMMEFGELTSVELAAVDPLHVYLSTCWQLHDRPMWRREALFQDVRWQEIRDLASHALVLLPDEERRSDWTRRIAPPANRQSDGRS